MKRMTWIPTRALIEIESIQARRFGTLVVTTTATTVSTSAMSWGAGDLTRPKAPVTPSNTVAASHNRLVTTIGRDDTGEAGDVIVKPSISGAPHYMYIHVLSNKQAICYNSFVSGADQAGRGISSGG